MNPDELRKLSQQAAYRQQQDQERTATERTVREQQRRQELWNEEWRLARLAVAELESNVQKAASEGARETVVYRALPNDFFSMNHIDSEVKRWLTGRWCNYSTPPEYAQYVFDNCPSQLNPRWTPDYHDRRTGGAISDGGRVSSGPHVRGYLELGAPYSLGLKVSW